MTTTEADRDPILENVTLEPCVSPFGVPRVIIREGDALVCIAEAESGIASMIAEQLGLWLWSYTVARDNLPRIERS